MKMIVQPIRLWISLSIDQLERKQQTTNKKPLTSLYRFLPPLSEISQGPDFLDFKSHSGVAHFGGIFSGMFCGGSLQLIQFLPGGLAIDHCDVYFDTFPIHYGLSRFHDHKYGFGVFLQIGEGAVLAESHENSMFVHHAGRSEIRRIDVAVFIGRAERTEPGLFIEVLH
jgi:hypothetical protein